jgi:hypothetical protein
LLLRPGISPFREHVIIQPATLLTLLVEKALLWLGRIWAIFEGLEHTRLETERRGATGM